MTRLARPPEPPPGEFNLAYFVYCLAYLEQEERLWQQRANRTLRVGATVVMCVVLLLLLACAPRAAVDVLPVPPLPAMNPFGGM